MLELMAVVQEADETERKAREKQARVEASMKEREKEVKESLETSLRERDKERDQHKKEEAVQAFKALLADLVNTLCFVKKFIPMTFMITMVVFLLFYPV